MNPLSKVLPVLIALSSFFTFGSLQAAAQGTDSPEGKEPLPHYQIGKVRPYDAGRPYIRPYGISARAPRAAPGTGDIAPPPEYRWSSGILLRWGDYLSVLTKLIEHSASAANDSKVFLVVQGPNQEATAKADLTAAGVDMNQVEFLHCETNSIWIRDYGPHLIWHDGTRAVVDSHYYSTRPLDNAQPMYFAEDQCMPIYDIPLMYSGGNFLCTANRHGYISDIIFYDNPGMSAAEIAGLYKQYQGVDRLHIFPAFPQSIDGTGHIDMWMCIVDDDKVIIGEYEEKVPGYEAYVITENAVTYMQSLGFTVYRVPNSNSGVNGYGGVHYTYTNGIPLNDMVIIPRYGGVHQANDDAAKAVYQAALPNHTIKQVACGSIIPAAGALHCIAMHVPAYLDEAPSAKVLYPNGGELWAAGASREIRWAADDDEGVDGVDIHLSMDGGVTFPYPVALNEPHDGLFEACNVPWRLSGDCVVSVTAHDSAANSGDDLGDGLHLTDFLRESVYDFSVNAGVDRWAFGSVSDSWTGDLEGNKYPPECSTPVDQIDPAAYSKMAYSDATGDTTDPNRFANASPPINKESTFIAVFDIEEEPEWVRALEFHWEGFTDKTVHTELYIWDYQNGNWSDGRGGLGENHFMDNCTHTNDRIMRGAVREKVQRYLSPDGEITFLIYSERAGRRNFHDYLRLTILSEPHTPQGKKL